MSGTEFNEEYYKANTSYYYIQGKIAGTQFLNLFVPTNSQDKIKEIFQEYATFTTGYLDSDAETYGDHLYILEFNPKEDPAHYVGKIQLLVITIKHTHH